MGLTHFPHGISSFGIPIYGGGLIGPGAGKVFHLVTSKVSTNLYWNKLNEDRVDPNTIFSSLTDAYAAMTSDQNDALLVYPGNHLQTASLTWAKNATKIIGVGSPNQAYQPRTLTSGGVRLATTTANVAEILNITGHYVEMYGIGTENYADDADNLADVKITGKNFYAESCSFRGGDATTQVATDGAGVPLIFATDVSGGANAAYFKNCVIGSSGNTTRTKGPSCALFSGGTTSTGFGIMFEDCRFSSRCETATSDNVCQIRLGNATSSVDRELYFKRCLFYNFTANFGTGLTNGIDDQCTTTHSILLHGCLYHGILSPSNVATFCFTVDPIAHTNGSEALATVTS